MNFSEIFLLLGIILFKTSVAQMSLKPSIINEPLPQSSDSICAIPIANHDFDSVGYQIGDTIPQFKLYTITNDSIDILEELNDGLPILLISGSYTCPVYRSHISDMNTLASTYNGKIKIFNIYIVEAHPIIDMNPYIGVNSNTQQNYTDSILFEQPKTYGERLWIINEMQKKYTIDPIILVDGLCNEWWLNFGPAPNIAYLINTNGVVFSRHSWFNKAPYNMSDDIDSLLAINSSATSHINANYSENIHLNVIADPINNDEIRFSLEGNDRIKNVILRDIRGVEVYSQTNVNNDFCLVNLKKSNKGILLYEVYTENNYKLCGKTIKL